MVVVTVSAAGRSSLLKGLPTTVEFENKGADAVTVGEVKAALAAKYPELYVERQKLSLKDDKKALVDEATLASAGIANGAELAVKDLGPQVSWRTVFLVEYVGPLVIHPIFYHLPQYIYGGLVQHSAIQKYVYAMVLAHYLKRELETIFVHRFSKSTMPFRNIFKNSAHYHILGGLFLAYPIYSPTYSAHSAFVKGTYRDDPNFLLGSVAFWLFCEISNFKTHLTTSNLRPAGTRKRAVPYGYGFNLVSFPNYFFESLGWVTVSVMTGSWAAWFFTAVSSVQMLIWAQKKHKVYKREFGKEFPRGRKAMIPFLF